MKKDNIQNFIDSIDEKYIVEAESFNKRNLSKNSKVFTKWKRISVIAACLVFVAAGMLAFGGERIDLPSASGRVSARYNRYPVPGIKTAFFNLVSLTEEEIFTWDNTVIFYGTIESVDNIIINFNGEKEYNAIAGISVEKIYRGNLKQGETVFVLLPCSIATGGWVEDTGVVSHFKKGVKGIFMPTSYNKTYVWECNGASVCPKDLANYGFADGERFAFLETDEGLVFSSWAFKSIENATTMNEIEEYVLKMIN